MTGRLTTHVLDTSTGKPAAGMKITLYRLPDAVVVTERITNSDGRVDQPLLEGEAFTPGVYELLFHAGGYFRQCGHILPEPPFLDDIAIRFGLANRTHYHVPLLVSPYGYSTYRGS